MIEAGQKTLDLISEIEIDDLYGQIVTLQSLTQKLNLSEIDQKNLEESLLLLSCLYIVLNHDNEGRDE